VLVLVLELSTLVLKLGVRVGIRARIKDAYGTKRLDTKRLGYKMSGTRSIGG